ncbi:MAG: hypothetical protein Tsb0015_09660 [Simkaniaceae bacterium]
MKKLSFLIIFLSAFLIKGFSIEKPQKEDEILQHAFFYLPEYGTLQQDKYGFVYVDIDDDYIDDLWPYIETEGFKVPPYFRGRDFHGAHISVVYEPEAKIYNLGAIAEIGKTVYFKIKDCQIVSLPNDNWDSVCLLIVEAPYLSKIRKKYGLPAMKHDFHITIGIKTKPHL